MRHRIDRVRLPGARRCRNGEVASDRRLDVTSQILLELREIVCRPLVGRSPETALVFGCHELGWNGKRRTPQVDASDQRGRYTELPADVASVQTAAFESNDGASRDHAKVMDEGQVADQPLHEAFDQVLDVIVAGK